MRADTWSQRHGWEVRGLGRDTAPGLHAHIDHTDDYIDVHRRTLEAIFRVAI